MSEQFGVNLSEAEEKAMLEAVDGSPSTGVATREVVVSGTVRMQVLANLPDLSGDQKYRARVRDDGNVVELGELSMKKAGWMLEATVNIEPLTHNTVEVYRDGDVILRGSFE